MGRQPLALDVWSGTRKLPQVRARGDQSRDVRLRHVGGNGLRQRPQEQRAASCIIASASPGAPRRHGGTRRASSGYIPSTQASIAAGASWRCTAGAWGASEAEADVEAAPGPAAACVPTHPGAGPSR
jgi:hypothetical protein